MKLLAPVRGLCRAAAALVVVRSARTRPPPRLLSVMMRRLSTRTAVFCQVLEAIVFLPRDASAGVAVDIAEVIFFAAINEGDRFSGCFGAAGAAEAVDVIFGLVGRVEVDDVRDGIDVDAARSHVCCNEDVELALLESGKRALALALRAVRVHHGRGKALPVEALGYAVGAVFRAREDDDILNIFLLQNVQQEVHLALLCDGADLLRDGFSRIASLADFDILGLIENGAGQFPNGFLHRSGEQHRLTLARDLGDDLADVADEAHVEHAISLVEDEHLDAAQVDRAALHVIEKAARRGDDDVDAAAEALDLWLDGHAAVNGLAE